MDGSTVGQKQEHKAKVRFGTKCAQAICLLK